MPKKTATKTKATKKTLPKSQPTTTAEPEPVEFTPKAVTEKQTRTQTFANTPTGFQETPESAAIEEAADQFAESELASPADESDTDCLSVRPNGDTCLEEMQKAKENPNNFTAPQLAMINAGRNLCRNCKKATADLDINL